MRPARVVLAVAVACSALLATAAPASAHSIGGREPTNVRVRVTAVEPALPGVDVSVADFGGRLELRNTSAVDVVVLGYAGEPYLRVGPDGVFENTRAPAVFQNRSANPPAEVPARYDAAGAPEWRKVDDGDRVQWHDHRAHAMASGRFDPSDWTIDLRAGSPPVVVHGDLAWVAPGPWWPWALLTVAIAVVAFALARRWWRTGAACALGVLVAGEFAHVVGSWTDIAATNAARLGAQVIPLAAVALGVVALVRVLRTDAAAAAPWVLVAAVVLIVAGGVGDVTTWFRSQLPWSFADGMARALVAIAFGAGIGLALAAIPHLRRAPDTAPVAREYSPSAP